MMGKKKSSPKPKVGDVAKLLTAARSGNCRNIRRLLEAGCDVNALGDVTLTESDEFVQWLAMSLALDERSLWAENVPIRTLQVAALHLAVFYGQESAVQLLLDSRADLNAELAAEAASGSGLSHKCMRIRASPTLTAAAAQGHVGVLRLLLAAGASADGAQGEHAFLCACLGGHVECAEELARCGRFDPASLTDDQGLNGVQLALQRNEWSAAGIPDAMLERLRQLVGDSSATSEVVEHAARSQLGLKEWMLLIALKLSTDQRLQAFRRLIAKGVDLNGCLPFAVIATDVAQQSSHEDYPSLCITPVLAILGEACGPYFPTPRAVLKEDFEAVTGRPASDEDCSSKMNMWTPLQYAVVHECMYKDSPRCNDPGCSLVKLLLEHGAKPMLPTSSSIPPVFVAASSGGPVSLGLMLQHDATCIKATRPCNDQTLFHEACEGGHADCAMLLLQHGIDTAVLNSDGRTGLDLAVQNGHHAMAEQLRKMQLLEKGISHETLDSISDSSDVWALSRLPDGDEEDDDSDESTQDVDLMEPVVEIAQWALLDTEMERILEEDETYAMHNPWDARWNRPEDTAMLREIYETFWLRMYSGPETLVATLRFKVGDRVQCGLAARYFAQAVLPVANLAALEIMYSSTGLTNSPWSVALAREIPKLW